MPGWPSLGDFPLGVPTTEEWERFRSETASAYELEDCQHGVIRISCSACRRDANRVHPEALPRRSSR